MINYWNICIPIRPGRCDIKIELKECDRYQVETIWESVMETKLDKQVLRSVPEYKFTPADLIFHLIEYVYYPDVDPDMVFNALYKKLNIKV